MIDCDLLEAHAHVQGVLDEQLEDDMLPSLATVCAVYTHSPFKITTRVARFR